MRGSDIMRAAGEAGRRKGLPNTLQEHEILMGLHLAELGFTDYEREYQFYSGRKWRFDFSIIRRDLKLAIELEGGIWTYGRHSRGAGFLADCRKYAEATILGWTVFRFPVNMVLNGEAKDILKRWHGNWIGQGKAQQERTSGREMLQRKEKIRANGN